MPKNTLLLNPETWDLMADASGDIAMATSPYSVAQDVASAERLFTGDYYYDLTAGIPYFQTTIGHLPPLPVIKAQAVQAALTVPDVVSAQCFISGLIKRVLEGQVQSTLKGGQIVTTAFNR